MSKTTRVKMKDRGNRPNGLPTITTVFTRDEEKQTLRIEDGQRTEVEMNITRDFALQLAVALIGHYQIMPDELMDELREQGHMKP